MNTIMVEAAQRFRMGAWIVLSLALSQGACLVLDVPADLYADAAAYANADASALDAAGETFDAARDPLDAGGAEDDASVASDGAVLPPNPACDFSGRWLITERLVASGIGVQQAALWWLYLDVAQSGDNLTLNKGLACGTGSVKVGALGANVDMQKAWPALQANNDLRSRTGRVSLVSGRCNVQWDRFYRVLGASMPYYRDPRRPLPQLDQQAKDGAAGWEDWDSDGEPGISIHITGILNGTRYSVSRTWTSYTGPVAKGATTFRLPVDWNQEESILGVTSDALKAAGAKDGDRSLHFALFVKLSDSQATGSDSEICAAIRSLAPELTPDAY